MAIYSTEEYSQAFKFRDKPVSIATVIRRCQKNMLPSNHKARLMKAGGKGIWVIEVTQESTRNQ